MVILLRCDGRLVVVVETVVLMAGFVLPAEAKYRKILRLLMSAARRWIFVMGGGGGGSHLISISFIPHNQVDTTTLLSRTRIRRLS